MSDASLIFTRQRCGGMPFVPQNRAVLCANVQKQWALAARKMRRKNNSASNVGGHANWLGGKEEREKEHMSFTAS